MFWELWIPPGAAMAVATPLVYVDCCPPSSSFSVAEQADTFPCYDTRNQLAQCSPWQPHRLMLWAGATWPSLRSALTPFHMFTARRTTA